MAEETFAQDPSTDPNAPSPPRVGARLRGAATHPPKISDLSLRRRLVLFVRNLIVDTRMWYLRRVMKMDIHPTCRVSLKANLDFTNPKGIHIDAGTYVAFHAVVFSHDMCRLMHTHTRIGKNCFIGAHAIILPGVTIGDECLIGAGAVVTKDVPSNSVCVGNPGKIVATGIRTREYGILVDAFDAVTAAQAEHD